MGCFAILLSLAGAKRYPDRLGFGVTGSSVTLVSCNRSAVGRILIKTTHGDHIVVAIADNAFFWCEHIIAVSLASSIQDIGTNAFAHRTGLESIKIPPDSSLTRIGSRAFFNCWALTGISISCRLRVLESFCLAQCRSINTFSIPPQLEMIGERAFLRAGIEGFIVDYPSRTFYAKD
jgi:hypothetical protein